MWFARFAELFHSNTSCLAPSTHHHCSSVLGTFRVKTLLFQLATARTNFMLESLPTERSFNVIAEPLWVCWTDYPPEEDASGDSSRDAVIEDIFASSASEECLTDFGGTSSPTFNVITVFHNLPNCPSVKRFTNWSTCEGDILGV